MADKTYKVYRYWIDLDGREWSYVGTTSLTLDIRAKGQTGLDYILHTPKFGFAIETYGWDNFQREILEDNLTEEEAFEKEKLYIQKFNSTEQGFNTASGGKGVPGVPSHSFLGKHHSEETKQKISQTLQGHFVSEETRNRISENRKGKGSSFKGATLSKKRRKGLAEAHGVYGILQYDLDGNLINQFDSISEASQKTGISDGNICSVLKGRRPQAGGYTFAYKSAS